MTIGQVTASPRVTARGRAEEGRDGEVGAGASGTEVTHGDDEENQAYPVGQKPNGHRGAHGFGCRKPGTQRVGEHQVDRSRYDALHAGQPGCVVERDFAGEVVVQPPGEAGSEDSKGWPRATKVGP